MFLRVGQCNLRVVQRVRHHLALEIEIHVLHLVVRAAGFVDFRQNDFQQLAHELLQPDFQLVALEVKQRIAALDDHVRHVAVADLRGVEAHAEAVDVLFVQFQLRLARLIGDVNRANLHVAAGIRDADVLFRPDVRHQLIEVVALKALDDVEDFVRVLNVVG